MQAHAWDLRAELPEPFPGEDGASVGREALVAAVAADWRAAPLGALDRALCAFAVKLTRTPGGMQRADVEELRALGLDDLAIHDAVQVVAYFNYVNRVADAVHVELEPEMDPYPDAPPTACDERSR